MQKRRKRAEPSTREFAPGSESSKSSLKDLPLTEDLPLTDDGEDDGTIVHGHDQDPMRPIFFVPGFLGSQIRINAAVSRALWPPYDVGGVTRSHELFVSIKDLVRLPHSDKVAFGPFPLVYNFLLDFLEKLRGKENFFPFWYDWTQSNRDSGAELRDFIKSVLKLPKYAAKGINAGDVVCHSMGGVVLREAYRLNPAQIRRMVFLASPHWGAPKAFFVLHPKADLPLFNSFVQKILGRLAWLQIKGSEDEDTLEQELKWLACRIPSAYELLPDRFYLSGQAMVTDAHELVRYPVRGLDATYYDPEWGFPKDMQGRVRDAMSFKDQLGRDLPGTKQTRLVLYSAQEPTYDIVDYDNFLLDYDYDPPQSSSPRNGDGTVPSYSASADRIEGSIEVKGDHSGLPEDANNQVLIGDFLQKPPA